MKTRSMFTGFLAMLFSVQISAQEYNDAIATYTDPLTKQELHSILIKGTSKERFLAGIRFSLKAHVIKTKVNGAVTYLVRMIIRNNPEEWPLSTSGYLLVNDTQHPLELIQIHPRNTSVVSASGMDGDVSVSTTEY